MFKHKYDFSRDTEEIFLEYCRFERDGNPVPERPFLNALNRQLLDCIYHEAEEYAKEIAAYSWGEKWSAQRRKKVATAFRRDILRELQRLLHVPSDTQSG